MKVFECSGTPYEIGLITGEETREEIKDYMDRISPLTGDNWRGRIGVFVQTLEKYTPDILEEMKGIAKGANVPLDEILRINLPVTYEGVNLDECTNIAFKDSDYGPILGKNNDEGDLLKPVCTRIIKLNKGIPLVSISFCGMLFTGDSMNAEGLSVGHSSVGSVFQRRESMPGIRIWAYEAMKKCKNTKEYVEMMTSLPLSGKGYSILCIDREKDMCSLEAPVPLVQIRRSEGADGMNCVNYYQLETLKDADKRTAAGKENAIARGKFLDKALNEGKNSLSKMKSLLRHHGNPSICRHKGEDLSDTVFSFICIPAHNRFLYLEGYTCKEKFKTITI